MDDHSSWPAVTNAPLAANPGFSGSSVPVIAHLAAWPHTKPLFGIAPGGACHAVPVARSAVGFYPTVSPLPVEVSSGEPLVRRAVCSLWRYPLGYPSRALPGTVLCGVRTFLDCLATPAIIQPSARGVGYAPGRVRSTGKRWARSRAAAISAASTWPLAHGRKCWRNAASS